MMSILRRSVVQSKYQIRCSQNNELQSLENCSLPGNCCSLMNKMDGFSASPAVWYRMNHILISEDDGSNNHGSTTETATWFAFEHCACDRGSCGHWHFSYAS